MSQPRPNGKADFIRECLEDPALVTQAVPLDEFNKAVCMRCGNRQCTRSRANNMLFDSRVANWRSHWFTDVRRAADDDPNFARIRGKNFQQINNEVLEVRSENKPELMPIPFTRPEPEPASLPVLEHSDPPADSPVAEMPATPKPFVPPKPQEHAQEGISPVVSNTPFQQGMVLPGKPKTSEVHVESGAVFTFGGGSDDKE